MTKKDYEMVAKAIAGCKTQPRFIAEILISKRELVKRLSDTFMMDNPDFDPGKFYVACYPYPEEAETELY